MISHKIHGKPFSRPIHGRTQTLGGGGGLGRIIIFRGLKPFINIQVLGKLIYRNNIYEVG